MNDVCVRLLSIELNRFKNVEYGKVDIPEAGITQGEGLKASILGIYGQNGSGKTAVIEAINFFKILISGQSLPQGTENFIEFGHKSFDLSFCLMISGDKFNGSVKYDFAIEKASNGEISVINEKISYSKIENGVKKAEKLLVSFDRKSDGEEFSPKKRYKTIADSDETRISVAVAKVVSGKDRKSFIFCEELKKLWKLHINRGDDWSILSSLWAYAVTDLFVIRSGHSGIISVNAALPFAFRHINYENNYSVGAILIDSSKPTVFENSQYDLFKEMVAEIDAVIGTIVPSLSIVIKEHGKQMTPDGRDGMRFELVSKRGEATIPLINESEGIRKIISILNLLIAVYNVPTVCVAIDELDSGIYEYLLGEILGVIAETGKGQLIFTSHNLRPLEMIKKSSILFTTTNPHNRYIHLTNVKSNNNLRDLYLRSINLGGQKEQIYEPTKDYEIRQAMRKAGEKPNG